MVKQKRQLQKGAAHVTVKDADSGEVISEHDFPTRGE